MATEWHTLDEWARLGVPIFESYESGSYDMMITDVTQEEWDAASPEQREEWRRRAAELRGEHDKEKPHGDAD